MSAPLVGPTSLPRSPECWPCVLRAEQHLTELIFSFGSGPFDERQSPRSTHGLAGCITLPSSDVAGIPRISDFSEMGK
jgi:hypothetical protein